MPILTKRERQDDKLALANADRVARNVIEPGRYTDVTADATQLPTRYAVGDNDTNNVVNNPNTGGLLPGRPWNSTTSVYAILAFEPKLVFDFTGNVFKTGGADSTLANSVTHARAGQATMVDSDGLLKWAPHNLLPRSEELNLWSQANAGGAVVDNAVAPDGTTTAATFTISSTNFHSYIRSFVTYTAGDIITFSFWVRSDTVTILPFGINGGTNQANNNIYTNVPVTSTWNLVDLEFTVGGNDTSLYYVIGKQSQNPVSNQIGDVEIWHPHAYRSDLGGMVNNSAQSTGFETYVPTTNSAVYAPRVGHHVYNGSAWVNEGILHESEARTNLVTYSNDFTHSSWTKNATITPNDAVSPDGTSNASKFSFGGTGYFQFNHSITAGQKYTISAWVKSYDGTDEAFQLYAQNGAFNQNFIATSEWQRFSFTYTGTGATVNGDGIARPTSNIPALLHVYGIQIEAGATPSSYIPTSGSTVTRAAETLTVPAANLPYPTPVEVTGTELVTNGDFSDGLTGWTQNANATGTSNVIGGQLVQTAPHGDYSETKQLNGSTVGKTYLCSFKVTAKVDSSTSVYINFGRTPVYSGPIANIPIGVFSGVVTSVHPDGFSISTRTDGQITIDNVSVKEVNYKLSIQMDGKMTYADRNTTLDVQPYRWQLSSSNYIDTRITTSGGRTGQPVFAQRDGTSGYDNSEGETNVYSPGTNVPFNIAGRYGSTFINGAHEGTLLTANTTPTILPDLSSTALELGQTFMGTIAQFRMWDEDLTDAGIVEATEPSTEPSLQLTFDGLSTNSFTVLDWSE